MLLIVTTSCYQNFLFESKSMLTRCSQFAVFGIKIYVQYNKHNAVAPCP